MSFPRYPAYKDSGVEWLGHVPEHWGVDRMKWSTASRKNGIWGDDAKQDENDIPCVRVADFDRQRLRVILSDPTVRNVTPKERVGRVLSRNDLLLEKSGGGEIQPVGCIVVYEGHLPAVCSNFVSRVTLAAAMNSSYWRYLHFAAYAVRLNTRSIKQTSGIQNLDDQQYFDERCVFPPADEQCLIAAFLDHETAKIDALIAEQQRLIELLNEKRQAVISHAVTKGLNPNAPMKPSGVEWLGDVPEHWSVSPNKALFIKSHEFVGSRWSTTPLLSLTLRGVIWRDIESGDGKYPSDFSTYQVVRVNDLVFCLFDMDETPRTVGLATQSGMLTSAYDVFRCKPGASPEFIYYYYLHIDSFKGLKPFYTGLRKVVRSPTFLSIKMPSPPLDEQSQIADFLRQEATRFNDLIAEAERAIAVLQERRSALISAAVTGQIDVRGFVSQEAA